MKSELVIQEKYSKLWPLIAITSGLVAVLLFSYYLMVDEVLLEGYLRLIAFSFFALAVLSLFKVKDGKVSILFKPADHSLILSYSIRERLVYEESFQLNDIEEIKADQMPNKSLYNDFARSDRTVRFKKKKAVGWLYLTQLYGRVLPLTEQDADQIVDYIRSLQSSVNS